MGTQRPFRFGVVASSAASMEDWQAKARRAEELGYATLLVPDHFSASLSPVPALQAAASATTRLRVGSFVFDNDYRHPALLQQEVATLDVLTGGRVELGIGAGGERSEYEQAGIPFDAPGVRVERLAEAIAIIKGLFRPEPMNFAGKHYHISGLMGGIPAVQQPHPPLFVGGGGRRILTLAAREADIVGVTFTRRPDGTPNLASITSEAADEQVAWVRQVAGARFDSLELNILIQRVAVTDGADAADQAMEALSARWGLDRAAVEQSPHALIGSVPSLVEHLQERRERYGISYVAVFEPVMEALGPVVALLAGT